MELTQEARHPAGVFDLTAAEVAAAAEMVCPDAAPTELEKLGVPTNGAREALMWPCVQSLVLRGLAETTEDGTIRLDARVGFVVRALAMPERSVAVLCEPTGVGESVRHAVRISESHGYSIGVVGRPPGILSISSIDDVRAWLSGILDQWGIVQERVAIVVDVEAGAPSDRGVLIRRANAGGWDVLERDGAMVKESGADLAEVLLEILSGPSDSLDR